MKKIFFLMTTLVLIFALTGCASNKDSANEENSPAMEETLATETTPLTDEPEEALTPEAEEPEDDEPKAPADVPADIQPVEATMENPAQVGEWIEIKKYSGTDEDYHTAYCRITGIERGEAGLKAVEKFNEEKSLLQIGEMEDPDLEFCVFNYEVYFPEDFPQSEYGIYSPNQSFSVGGIDGGGVKAKGRSYIGLLCQDSSDVYVEDNPVPGDTWQGTCIFAMVVDCNEYLFRDWYQENGESVDFYIKGQ